MRIERVIAIGLVAICLLSAAVQANQPVATAWRYSAKPIEPCVTRHGRLSSQNGTSLTIWLIGSTRVVAVEQDFDDVPSSVRRYLDMTSPDHSYIYGDFEICPLEPDRPGRMRRVAVACASRLVVQNLRGSRPAFRLLSTWPKTRGSRVIQCPWHGTRPSGLPAGAPDGAVQSSAKSGS
jgi:hypothetical protein